MLSGVSYLLTRTGAVAAEYVNIFKSLGQPKGISIRQPQQGMLGIEWVVQVLGLFSWQQGLDLRPEPRLNGFREAQEPSLK
jgi:hypothetical protein